MGFNLFKPTAKGQVPAQKGKKQTNKYETTQDVISYVAAYEAGILDLGNGEYSKMYPVTDVNFKIASQNDQDTIFLKYGDLLNMFDNTARVEITVFNRDVLEEDFNDSVLIPNRDDGLDDLREEYNQIMLEKSVEGRNNIKKETYLTVTLSAQDIDEAAQKFSRIDSEVNSTIKQISNEEVVPYKLKERLAILYDMYNPGIKTSLVFKPEILEQQGITTKDVIAPPAMQFEKDYFLIGQQYGQTLYLQTIQSYLSTDFMVNLNDINCNMITSVHYEPLQQEKALKLIRNHIVNVNDDVINKQKRATKAGYSIDLISPSLQKDSADSKKLLNDVTSRNQKLFYVTFVLTHFASDLDTLRKQTETIRMHAQKYLVTMNPLIMQQQYGFDTSLPIGINRLAVKRLLTTEQASVFIPFSTQELSQKTGFYYGLNAVSRNLILYDRRLGKNSNGVILGTPGSGKSFAAKREILNVLLGSTDDVFIIDPDREYAPLAEAFGGQVVRIAAGSRVYINPLDMDMKYADDDDDPITLKSDYVCSLCETIFGGRYGLSESQKSIIDRCVREVYQPYIKYMSEIKDKSITCDVNKMPTLNNLYDLILSQREPEAKNIALAIERFVKGSLDIFAHRTNVDTKRRFVVYDIKDIGTGLKELGLQVCLNDIWNRTIANKAKGKRTWFYIDEFYLLTKTPSSAQFLQEIFKRARKWGGVPTGITQNVSDMLENKESQTMISNCDFVMMLSQSPSDKDTLAKMFSLSPTQLSYITNSGTGEGLLNVGKVIPFVDKYPTETKTYRIMSTKFEDQNSEQ